MTTPSMLNCQGGKSVMASSGQQQLTDEVQYYRPLELPQSLLAAVFHSCSFEY